MIKKTFQRGFTDDGFIFEVHETRFLGICIYHEEFCDATITEDAVRAAQQEVKESVAGFVEPKTPSNE